MEACVGELGILKSPHPHPPPRHSSTIATYCIFNCMFVLIVIFILIIVIINIVTRHISTPQSKVGPTNVPDHLLSSSHQTLCKDRRLVHFEVTFEGKDYACPFGARGEHLTCIGVPGAEGAVDISDF